MSVFDKVQENPGFSRLLLGLSHKWRNILETSFLLPCSNSTVRENKIRLIYSFIYLWQIIYDKRPFISKKGCVMFRTASTSDFSYRYKDQERLWEVTGQKACILTAKDRNRYNTNWKELLWNVTTEKWMVSYHYLYCLWTPWPTFWEWLCLCVVYSILVLSDQQDLRSVSWMGAFNPRSWCYVPTT